LPTPGGLRCRAPRPRPGVGPRHCRVGFQNWHTLLTSGDRGSYRPGMIVTVSLRLLYLIFKQVLGRSC
jgi:hypothetical protein